MIETYWAQWIAAIATAVSAIVALILLKQLSLAKAQLNASARLLDISHKELELSSRWNKLSAAFTFFSNEVYAARESAAAERLRILEVNLYHQQTSLAEDIVEAVLNDLDHFREVKNFLNFLEDYSTAVRTGVIDSEVSYALMAGPITRYYGVFRILIEKRREQVKNPRAAIELEKLALEWEPRRFEEEKRVIEEVENARREEKARMAKIRAQIGAPKDLYR